MNSTLKSILACLGNSPIVSIDKINQMCGTNVIVKLEKTNPGGSIKDRPAVYIIDYAERNGLLSPGGTIIESSSGNFGISLAMIGAARGYRVIILVDPKATATNIALMKALSLIRKMIPALIIKPASSWQTSLLHKYPTHTVLINVSTF